MTIKELNKSKLPVIKLDKKLEKLAGTVHFPEKLEKANETLRGVRLPGPAKPKRSPSASKRARIERT